MDTRVDGKVEGMITLQAETTSLLMPSPKSSGHPIPLLRLLDISPEGSTVKQLTTCVPDLLRHHAEFSARLDPA